MFLSLAGLNGPDFRIRWIQFVVVFLVTFFVAFAVILFVHRNVFAFEDYLNTRYAWPQFRWIRLS